MSTSFYSSPTEERDPRKRSLKWVNENLECPRESILALLDEGFPFDCPEEGKGMGSTEERMLLALLLAFDL